MEVRALNEQYEAKDAQAGGCLTQADYILDCTPHWGCLPSTPHGSGRRDTDSDASTVRFQPKGLEQLLQTIGAKVRRQINRQLKIEGHFADHDGQPPHHLWQARLTI